MRRFQVCGLGNALVDILVNATDAQLNSFGFEKGTMRLVDQADQQKLLSALSGQDPRMVSGGSVANSIIALGQLGGKGAFMSRVGDDRYGLFYKNEFEQLGIDIGNPVAVGEATGTSVVVITPDAERTMRTALGACVGISSKEVDERKIADSEWLFIEGYVFSNGEASQDAIRKAVDAAVKHGTKIAITCSEAFVVHGFRKPFDEALSKATLLFANESEACALSGASTAAQAFTVLSEKLPSVVITAGADGVFVKHGNAKGKVPGFPCTPVDLTGAGDMLAGAFLYGITNGQDPLAAAKAACFLAMQVITRVGARLHSGIKEYWSEGLRK